MRTIGFNPKKRAKGEPKEEIFMRGSQNEPLICEVIKVLNPGTIAG